MRDYQTFRLTAIRYWEFRRIIYNVALVPPTMLGYVFGAAHNKGLSIGVLSTLLLFCLCVIGANVCYTLAYATEFLLGSDEQRLWWLRFGRPLVLVAGTILGMLLALEGGYEFAKIVHAFK